ncbi:ABC transporter ATP-binding protein [Sneathiella sp. HT1-7]|jgi:iron complex transport system ATP-binding protein|uniref:ABC transporter ATP-binding protein n=1 Tax=Sneathiella sp. HT1-7 TaxID=2887192 RepID=UPI001D13307C|nr:ABC transporter ATP-binding protein [Sneathiella sp. HT1-7]MCC3306180.1 ABC transporter ATP-binding protein [Sneathiella sp. HT1-7]
MTPVSIRSLSKSFGQRKVLEEITLNISNGEIVGLIGPNGSGKTTLLRCIAGLLDPDKGDIYIDGRPRHQVDPEILARSLSYLPQSGEIHWDVTVQALVALGRLPHQGRWRALTDVDRQAVTRAMEACDILEFRHRPVEQLSGGERSRVLLARAMAGEPDVLLADEPISGLDPGHAIDVMDRLSHLAHSGKSVVVVMHDLTLAARYCDRLVLLHDTVIAAEGAAKDVLTADNLARCYGIRAFHGLAEKGLVIVPIARTNQGDVPVSGKPDGL